MLKDIRDSRKEDDVDIELGTIDELPSKEDDDDDEISSSSEGTVTPPETPADVSSSPLVMNAV